MHVFLTGSVHCSTHVLPLHEKSCLFGSNAIVKQVLSIHTLHTTSSCCHCTMQSSIIHALDDVSRGMIHMPVRLPFSVGEPLAGESWPFQCVSDDKIIKKGRIFLPDLVFFIGYHNSADVFFVHDEVPATRLSRWCSSGSCRVAHRIPSARRVGQLSASKRDMARKERSTLLCQKWGTETRNDELSQGRNVALDLQPLSSRFSYSVTLPSILISHHVSTTGGIGGNGRWAHSHHCVGSRFMISRHCEPIHKNK